MVDLWQGEFGNAYTRRQTNTDLQHNSRRVIWEMMLPNRCESVLEVGAGSGYNLEAIAAFSSADLYACEPNQEAYDNLVASGIAPGDHLSRCTADNLNFPDGHAEAVITCGVLIHLPTDKLLKSMQEIYRCAARTIIIGEYFAPSEEMIPYRGQDNALWRRDYGGLFLDAFDDLHCVTSLFAWRRTTGLDNITFWRFDRGSRRH